MSLWFSESLSLKASHLAYQSPTSYPYHYFILRVIYVMYKLKSEDLAGIPDSNKQV